MKRIFRNAFLIALLVGISLSAQASSTGLDSVVVHQGTYTTTAIGHRDHGMARIQLFTSGEGVLVHSLTIDLEGSSSARTLQRLKVYNAGTEIRLKASAQALVATAASPKKTDKAFVLKLKKPLKLHKGITNLIVAGDISEKAVEGSIVDMRVLSVQTSAGKEKHSIRPVETTTPLYSVVFLKRTEVLKPGDFESKNYRIPALVTAADGSLVVMTDRRKYNSVDLPEDIDVVVQRSTDGGSTWSKPTIVAKGTGHGKGYGDVALIKARSGKLIALYVGGPGLWKSTPENPNRHYLSTSTDNGISWTAPRDITAQIYGAECTDTLRSQWLASFFGSGQGLCTRSGRLMAVVAVREPNKKGLHNYAVYSDDEGETWQVSERAIAEGDEAKVVELDNGDILMSSRTRGNRYWAKSTNGGITWGSRHSWQEIWGNACDADIIRYTSVKDGYDKSRILHTLPNHATRRNLAVWMSYDEGSSWPVKKILCPGTSAYSSVSILPDGTVGVYFEEDESEVYTMTFVTFSLEWLSSGKDRYTAPIKK